MYADDLVLCDELEEDLKAMVRHFVEVCRRSGLKVNAGKSKVMVLNGEEGLKCEFYVDGIRLEYVSEFKYLGYVLDESSTDGGECSRKGASGRSIVSTLGPKLMLRICKLMLLVLDKTLLVPEPQWLSG